MRRFILIWLESGDKISGICERIFNSTLVYYNLDWAHDDTVHGQIQYQGPYFPTWCLKWIFIIPIILVGKKYTKMIGIP